MLSGFQHHYKSHNHVSYDNGKGVVLGQSSKVSEMAVRQVLKNWIMKKHWREIMLVNTNGKGSL